MTSALYNSLIKFDSDFSVRAPAQTAFGLPVTVTGAIATSENFIGFAAPDETVRAQNSDLGEYYPIGETMNIVLRSQVQGKILTLLAGGTFAAGNYVQLTTGGEVIVEATATTKTLATIGIAVTAGSDGNKAEVLIL